MNDMSEYDAFMFRTSSHPSRILKNSNGQTVAYIHSLIYVSSRATRCVVSVPAENFIAAHPNKEISMQ